MDLGSRIGAKEAAIVVFTKGGRDFRLERLARGEETPREFFYGYFELEQAGLCAAMISSAGAAPGALGTMADAIERGFAASTALGVRPLSARLAARFIGRAQVLISFTDGFSLSLGLGYPRGAGRPILIGGFHGLSDIEARARGPARMVRAVIRRALAGLDHIFFFGPADRDVAVLRYGLERARTSVIVFGVDSEFWRPLPGETTADFVLAPGQDPNRDYDLLAAAPGRHPTMIVTRQKVKVPNGAHHVRIAAGDFFGAESMSDEELRRLYNQACAVVVPLKDVWQPSGYSVTLQAMSCGRPVILTKTRGLWAPDLLHDGGNCLLVPPGDAAALGATVGRLRSDPVLAARLGRAARATVLAHFGLERSGAETVALARRGLALSRGRHSAESGQLRSGVGTSRSSGHTG
jgi:hypothetical protein